MADIHYFCPAQWTEGQWIHSQCVVLIPVSVQHNPSNPSPTHTPPLPYTTLHSYDAVKASVCLLFLHHADSGVYFTVLKG